MGDIISTNSQASADSWKALWNRPGGGFAKFTAVLAAGGLVYGFFKALPFLIAGLANTMIFMAEIAGLAIILFILTSKEFWKWISLFWLQINRKIVSKFVKIDPISILENGIRILNEKLGIVDDNIKSLGGVVKAQQKDLVRYNEEFDEKMRKLKIAKELLEKKNASEEVLMQQKSNYILLNNDISRLAKVIEGQEKRVETSQKYLAVMKKLQLVAKAKVQDSESELHWRKQEYQQAIKQQTAMRSISSILSGGLSRSLEEELAIGYVTDTINESIAEMESLLDGSNDLLANFDLQSAANIDKVNDILANYEKNGFSSFKQIESTATPVPKISMTEEVKISKYF